MEVIIAVFILSDLVLKISNEIVSLYFPDQREKTPIPVAFSPAIIKMQNLLA